MTSNPYPSSDVLHLDFAKAEQAQLNPSRKDAIAALLVRGGCVSDAILAYNGVDPVHEVDAAYMADMSDKEQFDETMTRSIVGVHAAEVLLGDARFPGLFDHRHSRKVRELAKQPNWYKDLFRFGLGEHTPYDNIAEHILSLSEVDISTEQLITINKAAEMLSSGLTWWQMIDRQLYLSNPNSYKDDDRLLGILKPNQEVLVRAIMVTQELIYKKAFDTPDFGVDPEDTMKRAAIGLRAKWRTSAVMLHPHFRFANSDTVHNDLGEVVEAVQSAFLEQGLIDTSRYPKSDVKGLLHEALWFLDANMMLVANPEQFGTTGIGTAAHRFDYPLVGKPQLNRGFDYGILDVSDYDADMQLINLKAGKHYPKQYHPRIKQVIEEGFDMTPRRISAKLAAYQRVLDSKFTHPDTDKILARYILPTVAEELEPYRKDSIDPDWIFVE